MMKHWSVSELRKVPWFQELVDNVKDAVRRQKEDLPDRRPALRAESEQLEEKIRGWSQSLANPNLPASVRRQVEENLASALDRSADIESEFATLEIAATNADLEISVDVVAERLNLLADILAQGEPTRTNLELSTHIDRIIAFDDGRVVVRTCRLGALGEVIGRLSDPPAIVEVPSPNGRRFKAKPRRRARLRVSGDDESGRNLDDAAYFVSDVNRYGGLGPEWFTEDEFRIPEPTFWAKENAEAVGARRKDGLTHDELSEEFHVSVPTIRHALKIAAEADESLNALPKKMPRARWAEENYLEVAAKRREGLNLKELIEFFRVSQPLISEALKQAGLGRPRKKSPDSEAA